MFLTSAHSGRTICLAHVLAQLNLQGKFLNVSVRRQRHIEQAALGPTQPDEFRHRHTLMVLAPKERYRSISAHTSYRECIFPFAFILSPVYSYLRQGTGIALWLIKEKLKLKNKCNEAEVIVLVTKVQAFQA